MAVAKTGGNKNKENLRVRKLNGNIVINTLYNGKSVGHGKYFAGMVSGSLVLDDAGVPMHFRDIGELVPA